jgi:uncharacterized protein (DUF58 family)
MLFRNQTTPSLDSTTPVRRRPSLDFSVVGLVYCAMMLFMGLAAINSQANLLFGVFGWMIGILLISGVVSRKVLRKVSLRRVLPEHGVVGRPLGFVYQVTNQKRFWPSLSVTIAELDAAEGFTRQPLGYMLHAAAGMTASVPAEVIPKRRGLHQFDYFQVSTSFPFGFLKRAITDHRKDHLLVYPPLAQVDRRLLSMCRSAERVGPSMRPRQGGEDEFFGVKEYRPGDNPKRIYWKRSARTASQGTLVAKEMTQVAPPRLLLLVDTCLVQPGTPADEPASPQAIASVEKAVAMAASLAATALDEELSVGLVAWNGGAGGGFLAVEPGRGKRHRGDLLTALARLPQNNAHDANELSLHAARLLQSGTTAVLVTPQARESGLSERGRNASLVISVESELAEQWFRFEPGVDFTTCVPPEHAALPPAPRAVRRLGEALIWTLATGLLVIAMMASLLWLLPHVSAWRGRPLPLRLPR